MEIFTASKEEEAKPEDVEEAEIRVKEPTNRGRTRNKLVHPNRQPRQCFKERERTGSKRNRL